MRNLARWGAALVLLTGCGGEGEVHAPPRPAGIPAVEPPAGEAKAERAVVPLRRELAATVRSTEHIQASAETAGRVLRVHADVGEFVKAGDLLAELDDSSLQAALTAARAAVELAETEAARVKRLRDEAIAPEREWDRAQTVLRQAQAQLELARIQQSKARVLSPVDAVVEARLVGPGDLAVPGTPLFQLYDPTQVCLEAQLPVGDREYAALGAELDWRIGAHHGRGAVSEVAPRSDPRSRTVRIRVPLDADAGERPWPGDFGVLLYRVGEREQVQVPAAAVFRVGQVEMVLVRLDGVWHRRAVRTGGRIGDRLEILAGLAGGETVGLP
jgi:RND family efflux transporter MFP subunit